MRPKIYWCHQCNQPIKTSELRKCPCCGNKLHYLTTDVRPVFARERRILQFYGYGHLANAAVWKSSKSKFYYINGKSVSLPNTEQIKADLSAIAAYINESDHYDALDKQLITDYQRDLALPYTQDHLNALEQKAAKFVKDTVKRFPEKRWLSMVSFSGGKDSTVVSEIVRRALGRSDILHVFGDTTLEDENTYDYVRQFREENPLIPFFEARAEHNFHEMVDEVGPPSRSMRWCCTIFKAGPINNLLQTFGNRKVLTFYGVRRAESFRRSKYDYINGDPDSRKHGNVIAIDKDDEYHGVTAGAKIGQQVTASPILDWSEFDVWLYILSHNLTFNKSYRLGYSRVGCWLCPLNSDWSEMLANIFFPDDAGRWHNQLIEFARKIGKPDPEEYVADNAWKKRFGGQGLPNQFTGLEVKPCGDMENAVQIDIKRPVDVELEEFLKPLGKINRSRSRPELGEIYLEARPAQDWSAIIVQAIEGETTLRFTVLDPKDFDRMKFYLRFQATKFQTCIQCTACSAVCPHGAITIKPDQRIYEIDQEVCTGCMECVTHFGARGCLVADALHATPPSEGHLSTNTSAVLADLPEDDQSPKWGQPIQLLLNQ